MSTAPQDQSSISNLPVVTTEGGSVTLVELASLRARMSSLQETAKAKSDEATSLRALAARQWSQLGSALLASGNGRTPDAAIEADFERALSLKAQMDADDASLGAIHEREGKGLAGVLGKVGHWKTSHDLTAARTKLDAELQALLVRIGQAAKGDIPTDPAIVREQAAAAEAEALTREMEGADASTAASSLKSEVDRRSESERELGFDALYLAAYLQTHGPGPVQSPLILKKGEQAYLSLGATLSRQRTRRQWVGGSQGFSFPIGHTGIRYRVGSFRGHPVEQQFLGRIDSGTLIITSQRIAFIGAVKSTSTTLAKLLHVECYSDAVAVFQEGRENPDYYLTGQPKYVLFMINWALNRVAA